MLTRTITRQRSADSHECSARSPRRHVSTSCATNIWPRLLRRSALGAAGSPHEGTASPPMLPVRPRRILERGRTEANMKLEELMSTALVTVHPDTPLKEVARTLLEKEISGMPVVDDDGAVVGVIAESDVIAKETGAPLPVRQG